MLELTEGYPHLTRLLNATKFPWLLSNIVDDNTGKQPEKFLKYWITERCGVKIGVIGLVERYVPQSRPGADKQGLDSDDSIVARELHIPLDGRYRYGVVERIAGS